MIIIWGKKYVYTALGYVADFCPLCREVRAFALKRVGLVGHVFYVSLTKGELAGHERRCMACGTDLNAKAELYARPSPQARPLRELIPMTFPNLVRHYADRFALEKALHEATAKIAPADRVELLKEPFTLLSYKVEQRFRGSLFDGEAIAAFFAALIVFGAAGLGLVEVLGAHEEAIWIGVAVAALAAAAVFTWWSRRRFIHRDVLPPLLSALHALKPTREELAGVLKDLKALGFKIGRKVRPDVVIDGLHTYVRPKAA